VQPEELQVDAALRAQLDSNAPGRGLRVVLLSILLLLVARAARAQDPFEIQVYDSETAAPLESGIELHTNYFGQRTAVSAPGPVRPTGRVFHVTFEPHLGLADWAEVGGYLQTVVRPDGSYDYAGAKLRFKARLPWRLVGHVGVAVNTEVSAVPRAYSESRFGAELRPIVDLRVGWAYLSLNPILDIDFGGDLAGRPQLEPATKVEVTLLDDHVGLGVEYYAAIGPLTAPLGLSQQAHRLFGVVDLMQVPVGRVHLGFNLGVGHGLAAGDEWIVKSIIGMEMR
jgi:hypothetical protein